MQIKEIRHPKSLKGLFIFLSLLCSSFLSKSQTTYLTKGDKQNILLERMEIKLGDDSILNFSKTKPFSRKNIINTVEKYYGPASFVFGVGEIPLTLDSIQLDRDTRASCFSRVDIYNMRSFFLNNNEWVKYEREFFKSKKAIWKSFYKTPANLYEVHIKDFDLIVNPVIQFVVSKEQNNNQHLFLNTRGLYVRGKIASKIGYYAYLTDNQERDPAYVQQWVDKRKAVPGQGYYKSFKTRGYDYCDASGYFTFNVTK